MYIFYLTAGSGVPELFSVWENEGWEEPSIEEENNPDRTILTLKFIKKATKKSDEKKATEKTMQQLESILSFMQEGKWYKLHDIAELLSLKETRTKDLLKILIEEQKILEKGRTKGKKYQKI